MNSSVIFRIFCFLTVTLLLSNIVSDFRLTEPPYLNIMMQLGLMIFLIDLGFHVKTNNEDESNEQSISSSNYHFLASKFGLGTIAIAFLIQSFSI